MLKAPQRLGCSAFKGLIKFIIYPFLGSRGEDLCSEAF